MRAQHVADKLVEHRIRVSLVTEGNASANDGVVVISPAVYVQVATIGSDCRVIRISGRAEHPYPSREDLTQLVVDVRDALWRSADPDLVDDPDAELGWCPRCMEVVRTIDDGATCSACKLVLP